MASNVPFYLALDGCNLQEAINLTRKLSDSVAGVKIHALWDAEGPQVVGLLRSVGAREVWADLKLKDTPRTVQDRAERISESGADMLTVHADGDIEMMQAALDGAQGKMEIIAITALTSLSEAQIQALYGCGREAAVLRLARNARLAGINSLVCSGKEVLMLRHRPELEGMRLIVPGTRSIGVAALGQKNVVTPGQAALSGASALVLGSQIRHSGDPVKAVQDVVREIEHALVKNGRS